jgi:hypothetical protein
VSAAYLAGLDRRELDTWMLEAEHATRKAHLVVAHCPLNPENLSDACGVAQDCSAWLNDIYDASMVLWAAEFDRIFDLEGDQ